MRIIIVLLLSIVLPGCGAIAVAGGTVKEAIWVPCPVDVPERPVFAADSLSGAEDLFSIGSALWSDRLSREAYEIAIRTRLVGCTRETPPDKVSK